MRSRLYLLLTPFLFVISLMAIDKPQENSIQIISSPSQEHLAQQGVYQWQTWDKEPSKFVWQFAETEKAYVLKGKVHIRPEGSSQVFVLKKGDFVTFAPGLRCHWDVKEPFKKHVTHEKDFLGSTYWKVAFKVQAISRLMKEAIA